MSMNDWPHLPDGLIIQRELIGSRAFGRVFEVSDSRVAGFSPKRALRVVAIDEQIHQNGFDAQVAKLLGRQHPYTSALYEVGETADGAVFLIHDFHDVSLWSKLEDVKPRPDARRDLPRAVRMIEQLLVGLTSLHEQGIVHGDVRTRNVLLNKSSPLVDGETYLVDTAIGGLAWWSDGRLRDDDARFYHPPASHGDDLAPSKQADVYAMGLTICELLAGRKANPNRNGVPANVSHDAVERLKETGTPHWLRDFVSLCLGPRDQRPETAQKALDRLQELRHTDIWWKRLFATAVAAAALCLACLALGAQFVKSTAVKERDAKISELNKIIVDDKRDIEKKDNSLKQVQDDLNQAKHDLEVCRAGPVPEEAQQLWHDTVTVQTIPAQQVRAAQKKYEELLKSNGPEDRATKQFGNWFTKLNKLHARAMIWYGRETTINSAMSQAVLAPWDDAAISKAQSAVQDLEDAALQWLTWAEDDTITRDNLFGRIILIPQQPVAEILKRWWHAIDKHRGPWTLRLNKGTTVAGHGTDRLVSVWGDPTEKWVISPRHTWSTSTSHAYTKDPPEIRELEFTWKPGNEMAVKLEAGGWYRFPNLIDDSLKGPLSLWHFNWLGCAWKSDGQNCIWFEIPDCPGPPRGWKPSVSAHPFKEPL